MRLGRRFIGADINLGAIQTTVKRLIGAAEDLRQKSLEDDDKHFTGFELHNVNHYDIFRNPIQAKELLIEALEVQKLEFSTVFDGEKDGRMVKIMPVNRIATRADLNELIAGFDYKAWERKQNENPNRPAEKITLVCMGHEPDLAAQLELAAKPFKIDVEVVDKRVSEVARRCSEEFKIGARVGQRFVYGASDVDKAIALLHAHGLPTTAAGLTDRADAVSRPGLSEKSGTASPHQDSVAYRIFRQGTPDGAGYCVATCHEVSAMTASTMMVVENFETFRQLHRYKWVLQRMHAWDTCLVVFRGDTYYPLSDAHQCVSASVLPQIGFHDFDPAGLHMSLGLPGLVEHLIPPMEVLEEVVQVGKRSDLYFGQLGQYGHSLESTRRANISELWAAMKRMQKGYPQEWMRDIR